MLAFTLPAGIAAAAALASYALAIAARPLAERLPPVTATWLLSVSAILLAAASSAVLGMLALTALVRLPLVDVIGKMSGQVISRDDPAALLTAGRKARQLPGSGQVVVTDDDAADAYTLPGLPCRIVITVGMLRALAASEWQVLLAHERAHAAGLHYLFGTGARIAAAANPLLHPVASAVGYTMERWADEHAAAVLLVALSGASVLEAARDLHSLLALALARDAGPS